ncbi:putative conserved membrane protein [Synechococcus sp. BIOS-E4-1]|uniref:hypothetical protein n=1 Tax=Synechococcus sp. BIOS-E4-1 TaxID=1400864 RepID=UPI0016479ABC|nr:hypothetical protein [Synechococcus sp. BIOS-E4-1]QNI52773.1 putative conserved membrane protein [Synechococcus sp. BIOS-E4-1]
MNKPSTSEYTSVRLISSPLRAAIIITLLISTGGLLWACFAKVPIYVDGFGLMIRKGNNRRLLSLSEGELHHNFNADGVAASQRDRELFEISQLGIQKTAAQTAELAAQVLALTDTPNLDRTGSLSTEQIARGSLLSWVEAPAQWAALQDSLDAYRLSEKTLRLTEKELTTIDLALKRKIELLKNEVETQNEFLETIRELNSRGYASRAKYLSQQSRVDAIRSEVLSHQERLAVNQAQLLQSKIAVDSAETELVKALRTYADVSLIFAKHDLFITDVLAPHLSEVQQNDAVLRVSRQSLSKLPEQIPGFLSQASAQQVRPGMKVLATPTGMSQAQYGGLLAKVKSVEVLPASLTEIRQSLGSEGEAIEISNLIPEPILITIQLEEDPKSTDSNKEGLKWSSAGRIPYPVREGDLLSLQITTQTVRPISLLIPWLRQFSGTSAPMLTPQRGGAT